MISGADRRPSTRRYLISISAMAQLPGTFSLVIQNNIFFRLILVVFGHTQRVTTVEEPHEAMKQETFLGLVL